MQIRNVNAREAMVGASSSQYIKLSMRTCVLELDLYEATPEQVPKNRTFWILPEFFSESPNSGYLRVMQDEY